MHDSSVDRSIIASNEPTYSMEALEPRQLLSSTFHMFPLATGSHPDKVITGLDGSIYVFEHGANELARLRPHGTAFQLIPVPASFDTVHFGMVLSAHGDVYFSVHDGIGAYSPKFNSVTIIPLTYTPNDFAPGPDGNLWFTSPDNSTIGRMTLTKRGQFVKNATVATWTVPSFNNTGNGIVESALTKGPKGDLWFTENAPGIVAQIIPTKGGTPVINEFALPNAASGPLGIAIGRDGNVWFAETTGNAIGRINEKTKVITEFAVPRAGSTPFWISPGPDNALWFTEISGDHLGRITYGGIITESDAVPGGAGAGLSSDIKGPRHTILFTERDHDAVGELLI